MIDLSKIDPDNMSLEQAKEYMHKLIDIWEMDYRAHNVEHGDETWPMVRSNFDWIDDFKNAYKSASSRLIKRDKNAAINIREEARKIAG